MEHLSQMRWYNLPETVMRPTNFKIESLGYETFAGFSKDEKWNGWDCPYFTFAQAQNVLEQFNQFCRITGQTNLAKYNSETDSFVFPATDNEQETFEGINENGQIYYPLGAFYWIWEEIE